MIAGCCCLLCLLPPFTSLEGEVHLVPRTGGGLGREGEQVQGLRALACKMGECTGSGLCNFWGWAKDERAGRLGGKVRRCL